MASVDVLVIGRNTFEKVITFEEWPYSGKRVVVLSSRAIDLPRIENERIEAMCGAPAEIFARLESSGAAHAYIDGGITIQRFLREGLIQSLVVTHVPVLVGDGIPLFGSLPHDVALRHIQTTTYKGGLVKSEYEVLGQSRSNISLQARVVSV